jgi:hypothetical protein
MCWEQVQQPIYPQQADVGAVHYHFFSVQPLTEAACLFAIAGMSGCCSSAAAAAALQLPGAYAARCTGVYAIVK